jgi:hypothetical protein
MRAGMKRLSRPTSTFRHPSDTAAAPTPIRVSTEERRRRRSPFGFVEALARRFGRRHEPADLPFRYVFVIAYAHSGSARLYDALATIEGFHATAQNADALHGLFFAYENGCRAQAEQASASPDGPSAALFHDLAMPSGVADRAEALAREEPAAGPAGFDAGHYARRLAQAFVDTLVQPPARARLIGFHEMRYFERLEIFDAYVEFLMTAFVPALVVFNKRDPAAVARSGAWQSYPEEAVVAELTRFDARAGSYAAAHPANAIVVDHGTYGVDSSALRPLFERLGAPFDAAAVARIFATPLDS